MRRTLSFIGAAALISGLIVGLSTASSSATPVPKVPKVSTVPQRADPVLVVSPGHLHDWHLVTNKAATPPYSAASSNPSSTASYLFREGPGRPPLGEGSLELATGSASDSRVAVGPLLLAGKPLHSLDRVTYDTYLIHAGTHGAMPIAFKIAVTSTALGHFTTLIFEPARQSGHAPAPGEWQAWNALGGRWWATGVTGDCSQAQLCTWSQLKSRIGGSSVILISYFELGASGDAQVGTACALDAVVINDPVYDLEAEQPQVPGAGEETPEIPPEEGEVVPGTSEEVPVTG
jgi:hypothetical protein